MSSVLELVGLASGPIGAIGSFIGGSAFRAIWGEISDYIRARRDHKHELEMLNLNAAIDERKHKQTMELLALQHSQAVDIAKVQAAGAVELVDARGFNAVAATLVSESNDWTGMFTKAIRPSLATIATVMWVASVIAAGCVLSEFDRELLSAILGLWIADRVLAKQGR